MLALEAWVSVVSKLRLVVGMRIFLRVVLEAGPCRLMLHLGLVGLDIILVLSVHRLLLIFACLLMLTSLGWIGCRGGDSISPLFLLNGSSMEAIGAGCYGFYLFA